MPRLSAALITLTEIEQAELQQILKRKKTPQQLAWRSQNHCSSSPGQKSRGDC
jgi:hypothetical protein